MYFTLIKQYDLILIFVSQVDEVHTMFKKIDELRTNGWVDKPSEDEEVCEFSCSQSLNICVKGTWG